jgi:hypothetical protein
MGFSCKLSPKNQSVGSNHGKSPGNHRFSQYMGLKPVNFPTNQLDHGGLRHVETRQLLELLARQAGEKQIT